MIIHLDCKFNAGLGDAVWMSWIPGLQFHTKSDTKRTLLTMLGKTILHDETQAIDTSPAYQAELDDFGTKPRYKYLLDFLKLDVTPKRPTVTIPAEDRRWAKTVMGNGNPDGKKFILLFPQVSFTSRQWPLAYWLDLATQLHQAGYFVAASYSGKDKLSDRWPAYIENIPVERMAALMKLADMVIGNDSFPAHLSSTIGTRTMVLMGPTRPDVVFGHMIYTFDYSSGDTVWNYLSCKTSMYECTGCGWRKPVYRPACIEMCRSLSQLMPERVFQGVVGWVNADSQETAQSRLRA